MVTVKYLTPQNTFLEDLRHSKLEIFLLIGNSNVCKETLTTSKNGVPERTWFFSITNLYGNHWKGSEGCFWYHYLMNISMCISLYYISIVHQYLFIFKFYLAITKNITLILLFDLLSRLPPNNLCKQNEKAFTRNSN